MGAGVRSYGNPKKDMFTTNNPYCPSKIWWLWVPRWIFEVGRRHGAPLAKGEGQHPQNLDPKAIILGGLAILQEKYNVKIKNNGIFLCTYTFSIYYLYFWKSDLLQQICKSTMIFQKYFLWWILQKDPRKLSLDSQ